MKIKKIVTSKQTSCGCIFVGFYYCTATFLLLGIFPFRLTENGESGSVEMETSLDGFSATSGESGDDARIHQIHRRLVDAEITHAALEVL